MVQSSTSTTTSQNNLPPHPHLLSLLSRPRPRLPYGLLNRKIPAPRYGSRRPASISPVPHPYSTRSRWLPNPFSRQRKRETPIHVQHLVSPAFLVHGTGNITRCPGSTRYQEYLFNSYLPLIFRFSFTPAMLMWTFFYDTHSLWTIPSRLVFALHSSSLGFSLHLVVPWRLFVSMKCIIPGLATPKFNTRLKPA